MTANFRAFASGRGDSKAQLPEVAEVRLGPIRQLVLQPTPFCNLDCRYCYLPDRLERRMMTPETAVRSVECVLESGLAHNEVEVRWHAGEPLVVGTSYYRDAIERLCSTVENRIKLRHSLQTNGTLINDEWCRLFLEKNVHVGISIDGPADLNDRNRKTRSGSGTHIAAVRGIDFLRRYDIPFTIIAVLTIDSLSRVDELYDYFASLGATQVGFNIEEAEVRNKQSSLDAPLAAERLQEFLGRFYDLAKDGRVRCREFEEMKESVLGREVRTNLMTSPAAILCVGWNGDVTGFSPELLGHYHPKYGSFLFGNVHRDSLLEMLRSASFLLMNEEIQRGVQACHAECQYFTLCGGGAPSNKLGENNSFASTSTLYCTFRYKSTADVVLDGLESELGIKPLR